MIATTGTSPVIKQARDVITLACRIHGRKRGWHVASELLAVPERRIEAIAYGEPARVDPDRVISAHITLTRTRAAQLRAELDALDRGLNASGVELVRTAAHPCR